MKEKLYILGFTLGVTAFFGLLVSGLNLLLKDRIELNREVADQKVVLSVLGLMPADYELAERGEEPWSARKVFDTFNEKVVAVPPIPETKAEREAEKKAKVYRYYKRADGGPLVAIPVSGMGFWDLIRGYVALDTEAKTIRAIDFVEQKETPGLGARITEPWWRKQFIGLPYDKTTAEGKRIEVVPAGTAIKGKPKVDAITGASETSRAMETILNKSIARYLDETDSK